MSLNGVRHLKNLLLNNLDTGYTICFYNTIMNNFIFVIALTLFSIDSTYDVPSIYIYIYIYIYSFLFDSCLFYLFIYLFVDVLMYNCIIIRDNFLYLLVNQSMAIAFITGLIETQL